MNYIPGVGVDTAQGGREGGHVGQEGDEHSEEERHEEHGEEGAGGVTSSELGFLVEVAHAGAVSEGHREGVPNFHLRAISLCFWMS